MKIVFLFQLKVHRCSAFFVKSETQESPQFRFDILIEKGKVGCLLHSIFDAKCLQVYFTLSPDNFIFGDVISMWDMSFVFENAGFIYVLDHY